MLDGFRKHSNSIVVKGLLFLLIASFAAWGIGDMLRPAATGSSVATVDGVEISAQEVYNDFQREMARMRQLTGDQGINDNLSLAIGGSVVDRAVNRTLLAVSADKMDVAISDELVAETIRTTEMFQDAGQFSRARFEQVMFSNQLSEAQYIELVRSDLAREQVISALVSGATMPESVAKELYKHRQEKRSADIVVIDKDKIMGLAAATGDEIRKYYDDNIANFMAPQYRQVALLHITPADVANTIDVPMEKIEDAFAERQAEFKVPGRRTVEQMVFTTEDEAKTASAAIAAGSDFLSVAKDVLGMEQDALLLGDVTKADLPEELQAPVFALKQDEVSAPIKSLLGWHIARVTALTEEVNPTFDDVKDQIKKDLALEMAGEELFGISNDVEDALGGGATIEEAAKTAGFELVNVASVDANGLNDKGVSVQELSGQSMILDAIFKADINEEPAMNDDGQGGYFMVRVDGVTESKARPFDTVKPAVQSFVQDLKKFDAAKAQAKTLVEKIKGGKSLMDAAKEENLVATSEMNFTRTDAKLPQDVVKALFEGKVGTAADGVTRDGHVVAVLSEIKSMEDASDQIAINGLRRELANTVVTDLQGEFVNALRGQFKVNVDRSTMNRLFVQEPQ